MTVNGDIIVAELPFSHTRIYSGYGKIGVIVDKGASCVCCLSVAVKFCAVKTNPKNKRATFALFTQEMHRLEVDHAKPKSIGGKDTFENYQVLCMPCNRLKGDRYITIEELRELVRNTYKNVL